MLIVRARRDYLQDVAFTLVSLFSYFASFSVFIPREEKKKKRFKKKKKKIHFKKMMIINGALIRGKKISLWK